MCIRIIRIRTLIKTIEEISWAVNCLVSPRYSTSILGLPSAVSTTLKGQLWMSLVTEGSSNFRPIKRLCKSISTQAREFRGDTKVSSSQRRRATNLASKTVFRGLSAAWFFAASPIKRSFSEKATKEGVTRLPCSLATTDHPSVMLGGKKQSLYGCIVGAAAVVGMATH